MSIVLPTHNGSRHSSEAIESCLTQTYRELELIVVDDASTDETPVILGELARRDQRMKTIRLNVNRRLPGALNAGFRATTGELLTWTSDDNLYRPDAIERMVSFLREHPTVDVVYTGYTVIDDDGTAVATGRIRDRGMLLRGNAIGPSFLYRRRVYERIGEYAEDLFLAEDFDFWLRVSTCCAMAPLPESLYFYRWHARSLTATEPDRVELAAERALLRNLPSLRWAGPGRRAATLLHLARRAWRRGARRRAWQLATAAPRALVSRAPGPPGR